MIKKITYIAKDGEEFETEEECMAHEQFTIGLPGIVCFDSKMNFLDPHEGADDAFSSSSYIVVTDAHEAKRTFDYMSEYTGCTSPVCHNDMGFFKYNPDKDSWDDMCYAVIRGLVDMSSLLHGVKRVDQETGDSASRYLKKKLNDMLLMTLGS